MRSRGHPCPLLSQRLGGQTRRDVRISIPNYRVLSAFSDWCTANLSITVAPNLSNSNSCLSYPAYSPIPHTINCGSESPRTALPILAPLKIHTKDNQMIPTKCYKKQTNSIPSGPARLIFDNPTQEGNKLYQGGGFL